jgi:hypothetical protein
VVSPEFQYLGALPTPGWVSKMASAHNRLFAVIGGGEESCLAWEFQSVASPVGASRKP